MLRQETVMRLAALVTVLVLCIEFAAAASTGSGDLGSVCTPVLCVKWGFLHWKKL